MIESSFLKTHVVDGQAAQVVCGLDRFLLDGKSEISSFQKKSSPDFKITKFSPCLRRRNRREE